MSDWRSKFNMAKSLTTDLGLYNFNTALLANHSTMLHALVFAAITLKILHRTKYFSTEQAISFRLERPIVNGLRFFYLPMRPFQDFLRGSKGYFNFFEFYRGFRFLKKIEQFFHEITSPLYYTISSVPSRCHEYRSNLAATYSPLILDGVVKTTFNHFSVILA